MPSEPQAEFVQIEVRENNIEMRGTVYIEGGEE